MKERNVSIAAITGLSVVIINWKTKDMLWHCLSSIFSTHYGRMSEVIVVDNYSNDNSIEMVKESFPAVVLICNEENRGFAAANNQAFLVSTGRYILLLNSDTIVHGDVLAASTAYLDAHSVVGALGCRVLNTDGSVQLTCSRFPTTLNQILMASGFWKLRWPRFFGRYLMTDWQRDSERDVEVISGCYLMVRREVIEQVGPLDESFFFYGEETDWCKRIRAAGWRLRFAPVGEITHHGGVSAKKLDYIRDVMLTNAIVHFNRKHYGPFVALVIWTIGFFFNLSRAFYWSTLALIDNEIGTRERARHFRQVVVEIARTWRKAAP